MLVEKDIKILQYMLLRLLDSNNDHKYIYCNNFIKHEHFKGLDRDSKLNEFLRLANIFTDYDCATIDDKGCDFLLKINKNTANFSKNGGFEKKHEDELKQFNDENELKLLQLINLKLQNENFEFSQTIREKEAKIRDLELKIKGIELLKQYKWFIGICIFVGGILWQLLGLLIEYIW